MRMSYPASNSGVEMARMPRGAVASMLENEATKNTIFFDDFTRTPFVLSSPGQRSGDRLAWCVCYGRFANFKTHTVSTANPPFVSKLLKLCKIQQALMLGATEGSAEPFPRCKI